MKRRFFGTDGVRGPYGGPLVNDEFAFQLGRAAGRWLKPGGTVLIGRDTRSSGPALESAVARGLQAAGANPILLGIAPTPAVARAVVRAKAELGVVITASHNPAEDNGIKFFGPRGVKLTDEEEIAIEERVTSEPSEKRLPFTATSLAGAVDDYNNVTAGLLGPDALNGWKIVLDTANGATCASSPVVLRRLGAEIIGIGDRPEGSNINAGVGSEHPEKLAERVKSTGARLGVAHDGDGDRCVLCDETGSVLDGDEIMAILATHALRTSKLVGRTLVTTVQSNLGLDAAVIAAGGRVCRTSVGDRYVIERMLEEGAALGGESSGHIICAEISPTGDGLVAALKIIEVMLATGQPLSALRQVLKKFPQRSIALRVREKKPLATLPKLAGAIQALENQLGAAGRVLVRYSGTEAKLRLLVEGATEQIVEQGLSGLEQAARQELEID